MDVLSGRQVTYRYDASREPWEGPGGMREWLLQAECVVSSVSEAARFSPRAAKFLEVIFVTEAWVVYHFR
jgi:hypothetical protein